MPIPVNLGASEDPQIDAKAKKDPHGHSPRGYYEWIELDYYLETNTRFKVEVVQVIVLGAGSGGLLPGGPHIGAVHRTAIIARGTSWLSCP